MICDMYSYMICDIYSYMIYDVYSYMIYDIYSYMIYDVYSYMICDIYSYMIYDVYSNLIYSYILASQRPTCFMLKNRFSSTYLPELHTKLRRPLFETRYYVTNPATMTSLPPATMTSLTSLLF